MSVTIFQTELKRRIYSEIIKKPEGNRYGVGLPGFSGVNQVIKAKVVMYTGRKVRMFSSPRILPCYGEEFAIRYCTKPIQNT